MNNIVDYAEQTLDTFERLPFHAVDSLILSWTSYLHFPAELLQIHTWEGVRFADLFHAELFEALFCRIWDEASSRRLFTAMAASPRYREIRVMGYTERTDAEQEKQFAALSFQLSPKACYIAYRGTDSTLVGWKEDFNMAFQYPVPSQQDALLYLMEAATHCSGEIRIGGHSKGGNLAVYAAANSPEKIKGRIACAYSHDGPGFLEDALQSEAFRSIEARIDKTVPQSSVVGMLMEQQENYRIIKSSRISFWQHDPFSWVVEGNAFCPVETLTNNARYLDRTLNEWVLSLSRQERELLVETLYRLIHTEDAETIAQLRADWKTVLPSVSRAVAGLDPTTRKFITHTVRSLFTMSAKNFPELWGTTARQDILTDDGNEE